MTDRCEEMSFKNFEITPENYANFNMCKHLMDAPQNFRLVFLHMPSHERFHLKHALLNGWREKDEDVDWCSITASEFTNELLNAIRKGKIPYDARKWIAPDILLVDDIQELTGEATQMEFYRSILKKRLERLKTTVLFSEVGMDHLRLIMRDEVIHLLKLGIKEEMV